MEEKEKGFMLPSPIERVRRIGSAFVGMMANDHNYFDSIMHNEQLRRHKEDDIVNDLGERTANLDEQTEIEHSKQRHPSQRGYL